MKPLNLSIRPMLFASMAMAPSLSSKGLRLVRGGLWLCFDWLVDRVSSLASWPAEGPAGSNRAPRLTNFGLKTAPLRLYFLSSFLPPGLTKQHDLSTPWLSSPGSARTFSPGGKTRLCPPARPPHSSPGTNLTRPPISGAPSTPRETQLPREPTPTTHQTRHTSS